MKYKPIRSIGWVWFIILLVSLVSGIAQANLITNGDFESITTADLTQTDIVTGNSGTYGTWHTQPANWVVAAGGPAGSTQLAPILFT